MKNIIIVCVVCVVVAVLLAGCAIVPTGNGQYGIVVYGPPVYSGYGYMGYRYWGQYPPYYSYENYYRRWVPGHYENQLVWIPGHYE